MKKRFTTFLLLPALAVLLLWSAAVPGLAVDRSTLSVPKNMAGLALAQQAGGTGRVTVLLSTQRGQAQAVARTVQAMNGQVTRLLADADFLVASLPSGRLQELERSAAVRALAIDRPVRLDPTPMTPFTEKAQNVPSQQDPALSLGITRGEIRAPQFTAATGSNGAGTVIAVLDTGVDPGHLALARTPDGRVKIVDWQDFTGEGDIATTESRTEPIASIPTRSGLYKLGWFTEAQIPQGELKSDVNRNGSSGDRFRVLLTDSVEAGRYDTAYIDTNGDGDLSDEQPMRVYRESHTVGTFASTGATEGVSFVVTRINADGSGLNLGYDGGQHGTHVAGIAAASGPVTGVAPGAQIMAIKVLNSGGSGSWQGIIEGMHYAATQGARVINMSLGGLSPMNDGSDPQSLFIRDLSAKTGALFSIAAGNSGPGVNSVALPGVAGAAITSGAYISANTWKADYGLNVPQEGLWYFSSAGPRADGGLKPNVVSPGTANAPIPGWAGQYAVFQGTSMAAPQTSGAAALLLSAAQYRGMQVRPDQVRMAMEAGARRLAGYAWFEQGHGLLQVDRAWDSLQQIARETNPELVSFGRAASRTTATGLYAREFAVGPAEQSWTLGNREYRRTDLQVDYRPGNGLTISGPAWLTLGPLQRQTVPLHFNHPDRPGIYDALIQARLPGQVSPASEYLTTVIRAHQFEPARGNVIRDIQGRLAPGRFGRHFVQVPDGTADLQIDLNVAQDQGRVRLMLHSPDGMPYGPGSDWAGAPAGPEGRTLSVPNPTPGVWEIVAYASPGSLNFGLAENRYSLTVAARGLFATPQRIGLAPFFGLTQSRTVQLANYYGDLRTVSTAVGFVQPVPKRVELAHGDFHYEFIDVKEGTALLRASLSHVADPAADLDVGLYYNDPRLGGWVSLGRVSGHRLSRQVELLAPMPGQYAVEIAGRQVPSGKSSLSLNLALVHGGQGVSVKDEVRDRPLGSRWSLPVTMTLPAMPGEYLGAVVVRDEATGRILTVVPIEAR